MKQILLLTLIALSLPAAAMPPGKKLPTFGQAVDQDALPTDYATIRDFLVKNPWVENTPMTRQIKPAPTVFSLSGRQILSLDGLSDIPNIKGIEHLNLSSNKFNRLNDEINALDNLQELDLTENKFTTLLFDPSTKFKKLQKLYLYKNQILPTANMFAGLSNLLVLGLSGNGITQIPAGTFNGLGQLTTLQLDNNRLFELTPGVFNGLTNLKIINLRGDKANGGNQSLTKIAPEVFDGLPNLQEVHLQEVPISDENKKQLQSRFPNVRFNF
jgi:Leucine-rich repeat (LRR) protein